MRDKKDRRLQGPASGVNLPSGGSFFQASYQRSSILPPAHELEHYETLYPGTTRILLETYQRQVAHRIEIEENVIRGDTRRADNGQIMAFILALVTIIGGFVLVILGKSIIGISSILGALATLLGVFMYGTRSRRKERENKAKRT
jgi:Predicted membrane protein